MKNDMIDIVPQLRDMHMRKNIAGLRFRAADEIERLRKDIVVQMHERSRAEDEIERLRAALKRIAEDDVDDDLKGRADILSGIAWAALTGRLGGSE